MPDQSPIDGADYDHHPDRTWIEGTGYQDPPDFRPAHPASESIGRRVNYPPDGIKRQDRDVTELAEMLDAHTHPPSEDPCVFDHHGGCQAHGFLSLKPGELCPTARAHALLVRLGVREAE